MVQDSHSRDARPNVELSAPMIPRRKLRGLHVIAVLLAFCPYRRLFPFSVIRMTLRDTSVEQSSLLSQEAVLRGD